MLIMKVSDAALLYSCNHCTDDPIFQGFCLFIPTTLQSTESLQQFRAKGRLTGHLSPSFLSHGHLSVYCKSKIEQPASCWYCIIINRYYWGRRETHLAKAAQKCSIFLLNIHSQFKKGNTTIASGLPLALIKNSWAKTNAQLFLQRD